LKISAEILVLLSLASWGQVLGPERKRYGLGPTLSIRCS